MFLCCKYSIIIGCFPIQEIPENIDANNLFVHDYNIENDLKILNVGNFTAQINDTNKQPELGDAQENINSFRSNCNSDLYQHQNNFTFQNVINDNLYCKNNMVQCRENAYFNNKEPSDDYSSTSEILKPHSCLGLHLPVCTNVEENIIRYNIDYTKASSFNFIDHAGNSTNILINQIDNSKINGLKRSYETDDGILQGEKIKKFKKNESYSKDQVSPHGTENKCLFEVENYYSEISEEDSTDQCSDQSFHYIKAYSEKLQMEMHKLSVPKSLIERFLDSKTQNELFYSSFCSVLKELTEVSEHTKKLCKKWIQQEQVIDDSKNNKNIFGELLRLAMDVKNTNYFFEKSILQKRLIFSAEQLAKNKEILRNKIETNRQSIENIKSLGFQIIFEAGNSENNLIDIIKTRFISLSCQEQNSSNIRSFKIFYKKQFYPASFSLFNESLFLCICSTNQYLKILKIDLKTAQHYEFSKYTINEKENKYKLQYFGYGSRYSIIRSGSNGKLFLLKSSLMKPSVNKAEARNSFELLVVDKEFKKLACIKVDRKKLLRSSIQSAILDFVIHNDLVYALDINCRCIKILNESLVLLRTISFPESLKVAKAILLAVSNKFIFLGTKKAIYFINNNDQNIEFKKLELNKKLLNIACYDEDYIILRFIDNCYFLKIEKNLSDVKFINLPALDQLKGKFLNNFVVKDDYVYTFCENKNQIFKLHLNLNPSSVKYNKY